MKDISFGALIAFYLPGFVLLWGLGLSMPDLAAWFSAAAEHEGPSVAGFLFATLASLGLGMFVGAARWLIVDHALEFLFKRRGRPLPQTNFEKLKDPGVYAAFQGVVENHYRYYQYYSNTWVATLAGFVAYVAAGKATWVVWIVWIVASIILLSASADALEKYCRRAHDITK